MSRSIVLIGGPDTGKTNYIGRLWYALKGNEGALHAAEIPDDITFVEEIIDHLLRGRFAPRTGLTEDRRDFAISVVSANGGAATRIIIPDISGELWRKAALSSEIASDWMEELHRADGAIVLVRAHSALNEEPLDWVTSRNLLSRLGQEEGRTGFPTQVMLCELLRFLELSLADRPDGRRPRVAVIVTAWDLLDSQTAAKGPEAFLEAQYPLFAGRLHDIGRLEVRVYGLSVVGGDIDADADYREKFLEKSFRESGWVATQDAETREWRNTPDVTLPVAWVVGV